MNAVSHLCEKQNKLPDPPFRYDTFCCAKMATEEAIRTYNNKATVEPIIASSVLIGFFAICIASLAITTSISFFVIGTLAVTALTISIIAAFSIYAVNIKYAKGSKEWKNIYDSLSEGKYKDAMKSMKKHLFPKIFDRVVKSSYYKKIQIEDAFKLFSRKNFYYLDMRYPEVTQNRKQYMLSSLFSDIILICLFQKVQKGEENLTKSDGTFLKLAKNFTKIQRGGTETPSQKACFDYINGIGNKKTYEKITHKSINHEYSVIFKIFENYRQSKYDFDKKGNITNPIGAGYNRFKKIQNSLKITKFSLVKKNMYGELEKKILEPVLSANTGKNFIEKIQEIKQQTLMKLKNKIVELKNSSSE